MSSSVRRQGVVKLIVGGLLSAAVLHAMAHLSQDAIPSYIHSFALIPVAIPGVFALAGLVECVTGVKFGQLATAWDEFAGWQRGIVGLVVVTAAFAVAIATMVLFFQP
jgi:hypothetical protein